MFVHCWALILPCFRLKKDSLVIATDKRLLPSAVSFTTRCEIHQTDSKSNLLGFPELLDNLGSHLIVLQQVICDGVADPGGPLRWTQLQQLVPCLLWDKTDIGRFNKAALEFPQVLIFLLVSTWRGWWLGRSGQPDILPPSSTSCSPATESFTPPSAYMGI